MPEIGRELDHLLRRVLARAIPVHERSHGEGMAQIMDAGTTPMPTELFGGPQADGLADGGEVIAGAAIGQRAAAIRHEERFRADAEKPIPFLGIGRNRRRGAVGQRQQARFADFPRRSVRTPVSRSTSATSRESASLILRPVTAMRPNRVEQVSARMPLIEGSSAAASTMRRISSSL